jgi:hypothetical protein
MSNELSDLLRALNSALLHAMLDAELSQRGADQVRILSAKVDEIEQRFAAKFRGVTARGLQVTNGVEQMRKICATVKANATKAGEVVLPSAVA